MFDKFCDTTPTCGYVEKRINHGDMLDIDIIPKWRRGSGGSRQNVSSETQKKLNLKNRIRHMMQLLNANFTSRDIWITVGYRGAIAPSIEEIKKDVKNYIRRLSRKCKKMALPALKYLYVIEFSEKIRPHVHIVTNFPGRDEAEKQWKHGEYPQARRLKPNDFGLSGLACYMGKDLGGKSSYGYSMTLVRPWKTPHYNHSRYAKGQTLQKLTKQILDPKTHFEKVHKNYKFIDMEVVHSDWGVVFVYARLKRK